MTDKIREALQLAYYELKEMQLSQRYGKPPRNPEMTETALKAVALALAAEEFCLYCGAGIGKFRREGEGTCLRCDPEGAARNPQRQDDPTFKEPTDDELAKGTFSCPVCGLGSPHSDEAHGASVLPEVIYGVPSYDKTFLVWVGSDKQKAMWMADFSRNVIEYRRVDVRQSIERIARQAEELGEYDKFTPSDKD